MKMKKKGWIAFVVIFALIMALSYLAFFGVEDYYGDTRKLYVKGAKDIRWGIDISGGVEAVFAPDKEGDISRSDIDAAKSILEVRLTERKITDYEVYADYTNHRVIVRFPWAAGESDFDANKTVEELGSTALLTFCRNEDKTDVILTGSDDVKRATAGYQGDSTDPVVHLELTASGGKKFAAATAELVGQKISIWMDDTMISAPTVQTAITGNSAVITGVGSYKDAEELANKINGGSLPFRLTAGGVGSKKSNDVASEEQTAEEGAATEQTAEEGAATEQTEEGTAAETTEDASSEDNGTMVQVISPTLGSNALRVMLVAGSIAFGLVCLLMILRYRLHGVVASVALLGQLAGTIAAISGFFPGVSSFTLTVPGIAGIILSVGVGVDCNVIAAERIRDEYRKGKTLSGAINSGFKNSLSAIIDGNVTIVIVSLVLMGCFGTSENFLAKLLSPIMSLFGTSIAGSIYAFGYTLLIGVIFNLIMGVLASKYMMKSIAKIKFLKNPALYGGMKNG